MAAETPEGILLELRPAGVVVRFYAFLVDWGVRLVILYAAAIGNLMAHVHARNPATVSYDTIIANNVVYNSYSGSVEISS